MTELAKTFDPGPIEARWYGHWEEGGLFRPARDDREPFTIVMPPPNVTGSLHIGHALDNTLQDILVRIARMKGKDALWVVGTDHAGIATQMVVERQLDLEQKKRTDLGRDKFVERVWEWKAESGGQITRQLRRLGASCDWANERFTMDEGFSKAVTHVFVELYRRGLLYRDKRLVNWDPRFQTAISDLEVETRDVPGKFWTLRYALEDGSGAIEVATTRPETMLADMAVAVHPDDARYTALISKHVKQPITGRLIPIIADEHADPELGSGAVKITPGHDFNDYEVGKRAGFKPGDMLNMLTADAHVRQTADGLVPADLLGLTREEARKAVVGKLEAEGALVKVEDRVIATPFGDRSGVVIEPWLTDQWYVDAAKLAQKPLEAVRSGDIAVVPETWKKTWYNWLENIQPWCVSRQLWWGHRIPAWFGVAMREGDGPSGHKAFVGESKEEVLAEAMTYYEPFGLEAFFAGDPQITDKDMKVELRQDEDVLDTWFSSALWPFATLGWPEKSRGLARHYPNDVLISGFDILFFWDARMAMQGFEFMGERPWKTLYLHGLVRDAHGQKMSKSKGNTVDPLGLIDRYGADALRFTLAAMESQGRDIKLDEKRVEGYRNFATKLWNAARFLQGNGVGASASVEAPQDVKLPVNRWIIGEVVETLAKLDNAIAEFRFDAMADAIYHFTWGTFCDWYVELVKGAFDDETRAVAAWAFDQILVMLHPFMPFVTEELWHAMGARQDADGSDYPLITANWPAPDAQVDDAAKTDLAWLIELVTEIRSVRAEMNVPPGAKTELWLEAPRAIEKLALTVATVVPDTTIRRLIKFGPAIARLARCTIVQVLNTGQAFELETGKTIDRTSHDVDVNGAASFVVQSDSYLLPLRDVIDLDAEKTRLAKAVAAAEKDRDSLAARLANPVFAERAKPEAVEKARADHDARAAEAERLAAALARLG